MNKIIAIIITILFSTVLVCNAANEWRAGSTDQSPVGTTLINDIDTEIYNEIVDPLDRLTSNYRRGMKLVYSSATTIIVSSGEIVCSNAAGTIRKFRKNTSNTNVTFSDIDTGAEASNTTYYVYANCDADAETATFKLSASSTTPTGLTAYRNLGSFENDSSSDIDRVTIKTGAYDPIMGDASGNALITDVRDFGTSTSSYTAKNMSDLKMVVGGLSSLSAGTSTTVTNLPFTSTSTFSCVGNYSSGNTSSVKSEPLLIVNNSGSQITIINLTSEDSDVRYTCIGH